MNFEESLRFYEKNNKNHCKSTFGSVFNRKSLNSSKIELSTEKKGNSFDFYEKNLENKENIDNNEEFCTKIDKEKPSKKRKYHEFHSKSNEKQPNNSDPIVFSPNTTGKKRKFTSNIDINLLKLPIFDLAKRTPSLDLPNPAAAGQNSDNKLANLSEIGQNANNSTFLSNFDCFSMENSAKKPRTRRPQPFEFAEGGSFYRYTIQRANKQQKILFGANSVITPVRSSRRLKDKEMAKVTLESVRTTEGLVYVPNELEKELPPIDEDSVILKSILQGGNEGIGVRASVI